MFAIVKIGSTQYKVSQKDVIVVDFLEGKEGDTVTFDQVLLVNDGKKTLVGKPFVKTYVITAKIVAHEKGKKIDVRRFKAKSRYRRNIGFRARLTKLEITGIASK